MQNWNDVENLTRLHCEDLLREANAARLLAQLRSAEPSLWDRVMALIRAAQRVRGRIRITTPRPAPQPRRSRA